MNQPSSPLFPSSQEVMEALKSVKDPELGYSIVDLGMVYGVDVDPEKKSVRIRMTLTTPCCPYAPHIIQETRMRATSIAAVEDAAVDIVWDPPWDPKKMASDEVKDALGLW